MVGVWKGAAYIPSYYIIKLPTNYYKIGILLKTNV